MQKSALDPVIRPSAKPLQRIATARRPATPIDQLALHYDIIIAGAGVAGLSLALHLINSSWSDRSILIVDKDIQDRKNRTLSYWTDRSTVFDGAVYRAWDQLHLVDQQFDHVGDLGNYHYERVRSIDLVEHAWRDLSARPGVTFSQGTVEAIDDGRDEARVTIDGQTINSLWIFDSILQPGDLKTKSARYHALKLHFKGWEIVSAEPVFNPRAVTFLDFRTPQHGSTRFFYVLPFSETRALVEYTLFSMATLPHPAYELALEEYLQTVLKIEQYQIIGEESGVIPVTDQPTARRAGRHILTIGAKGGRIKPTTGFAFTRIERDSAAIVQSLVQHGHPWDVPDDTWLFRFCDSLMLEIMERHGDRIQPLFTTLFRRNPLERVLRFLDEVASPREVQQIMASLPPGIFIQALLGMILRSHSKLHSQPPDQMLYL